MLWQEILLLSFICVLPVVVMLIIDPVSLMGDPRDEPEDED